jgi:hypothetical protein
MNIDVAIRTLDMSALHCARANLKLSIVRFSDRGMPAVVEDYEQRLARIEAEIARRDAERARDAEFRAKLSRTNCEICE